MIYESIFNFATAGCELHGYTQHSAHFISNTVSYILHLYLLVLLVAITITVILNGFCMINGLSIMSLYYYAIIYFYVVLIVVATLLLI